MPRPLPPIHTLPLIVDRDAVIRVGPVVALPGSAPVADQIAGGVELENRRRRRAALRGRRIGRRVHLARLERAGAMDDPDVVLGIDGHADRLAENPFVRQRLRPQRIDFEARRLNSGAAALTAARRSSARERARARW